MWFENGVHRSRSHLAVLVFSLGSYCRRVDVDPDRKTASIKRRFLWLLEFTATHAFDDVERIDYSCDMTPTSLSYFDGEATDGIDKFQVSLRLKSHDLISLWSFSGKGAVATGWEDVLISGDSMVDFSGDQGDASRRYAKLLCTMMDKTLT